METDFNQRRNDVIAEIRIAFSSETRGDSVTLHQAIAIINEEPEEEQIAAKLQDLDKNWWNVPEVYMQKCYDTMALVILSRYQKSFRYYLPAQMTYGLLKCNETTDLLNYATFYFFENDEPNSFRKSDPAPIISKFGFTQDQVASIASYLQFCSDFELTGAVSSNAFGQAIEKWKNMAKKIS